VAASVVGHADGLAAVAVVGGVQSESSHCRSDEQRADGHPDTHEQGIAFEGVRVENDDRDEHRGRDAEGGDVRQRVEVRSGGRRSTVTGDDAVEPVSDRREQDQSGGEFDVDGRGDDREKAHGGVRHRHRVGKPEPTDHSQMHTGSVDEPGFRVCYRNLASPDR